MITEGLKGRHLLRLQDFSKMEIHGVGARIDRDRVTETPTVSL